MHGIVLDLGGKRQNKRGSFKPPQQQATTSWWYQNLEMNTQPDIFADVQYVPIQGNIINTIVCTEVLEHIQEPALCVNEIFRLMVTGGTAFMSVPFLYPIHADPYDFQRFTEDGLKYLFRHFSEIKIIPMGGYLGTMGMFIEIGLAGIMGQSTKNKITRRLLRSLAHLLYRKDLQNINNQKTAWTKFTTGYFVVIRK